MMPLTLKKSLTYELSIVSDTIPPNSVLTVKYYEMVKYNMFVFESFFYFYLHASQVQNLR